MLTMLTVNGFHHSVGPIKHSNRRDTHKEGADYFHARLGVMVVPDDIRHHHE